MKRYLIVLGIAGLFACNNEAKKQASLADSLANVNANIANELKEKDSLLSTKEAAMTEFVQSFNEIQQNLNEIKTKEKIISTNSSTELKKSDKDQVISDIQTIYDLLNKNKQKVASLSKKLKASNLKVDELELAVTNLTNQLMEKETEIASLQTQLEKLSGDFTNLNMKYNQEKQASDQKTEKLNTAYYVVGTTKELKKNGVVTKEGGFIGLGKVAELNTTLDPGYFTKVDITQVKDIPIGGKQVKLVTPHPDNSYKLIEGASSTIKLTITDPEKFWSISKYLIISTEKKQMQANI
jgi:chromosome segregation ATPase